MLETLRHLHRTSAPRTNHHTRYRNGQLHCTQTKGEPPWATPTRHRTAPHRSVPPPRPRTHELSPATRRHPPPSLSAAAPPASSRHAASPQPVCASPCSNSATTLAVRLVPMKLAAFCWTPAQNPSQPAAPLSATSSRNSAWATRSSPPTPTARGCTCRRAPVAPPAPASWASPAM